MATRKTSQAVNSCQDPEPKEKKLRPQDVRKLLLEAWFPNLEKPSQLLLKVPEALVEEVSKKAPEKKEREFIGILKDLHVYFSDLEYALQLICQDTPPPYPPSLGKKPDEQKELYIEQLCSSNNPYDFAKTLEQAVDGVLHFKNKIGPDEKFFLYYFHRRQLEKAAYEKWFSSDKQIGRIWA